MKPFLPYGRQSIDDDDIATVTEALRGDFLTTGPKVEEFEKALCAVTGAKEAVACANGTAALHLAMLGLGIGKGDAVIVPSVTFLASANAARYAGAEVVFADVDPDTGLMGVAQAEEALQRALSNRPPTLPSPQKGEGKKVKAVMAVHLGGHVCDMAELAEFAKRNGLKLIADSCHALGGQYKDQPIGAARFEDVSTFSFHPVKAIATGEGGAITTNDAKVAAKMRSLRSHGMVKAKEPWAYEMPELGFNYRLTDMQCALGVSQLKKLPGFMAQRKKLAEKYDSMLSGLKHVKAPKHAAGSAWHLYSVKIDFDTAGVARAEFMNRLKDKGIGTQVHYIPVHTQPYYRGRYGALKLPGAEKYYVQTLSLPLFPAMTEGDVERVVAAVKEILE